MKKTKNIKEPKERSKTKTQEVDNKKTSVYGPYGYGFNSLRNYGNRRCITPEPLYVGE